MSFKIALKGCSGISISIAVIIDCLFQYRYTDVLFPLREYSRTQKERPEPDEPYDSNSDGPDSHIKTKHKRSSKTERNEYSRTQKERLEPDEPYDSNSDEGPDSHIKTKDKRSSKTERNELCRTQKERPEPDEPYDSNSDEGPDSHIKTKDKRSSKTERNGSPRQKSGKRPWSDAEKKAICRHLGNTIMLMKVPGKDKCTKRKNQCYKTGTGEILKIMCTIPFNLKRKKVD
nr:uncharacterized protein LOC129449260 isoform X3 [Misgurnus anguillicaudatus]